jgi:hypothetical protein
MDKHPQDRFRRLAIVASTDNQPQQRPVGQRWGWPGAASDQPRKWEMGTNPAPLKSSRTMPVQPQGLWLEALAWVKSFVRGYFTARKGRPHGAVVLPFRRYGMPVQSFRPAVPDEGFVSKKASGSVHWNNESEGTPQEGGRG